MTSMTAPITTRSPLRAALLLDAAVTGANALAYVAAADGLDSLLGIDAAVLRGIGVFLAVYTVLVLKASSRRAVLAVIAANVVWAVDSLVVAALDWGTPTATGRAWIVMQALAVAGFAGLQRWALRRAG